jgi:hypothetical protein
MALEYAAILSIMATVVAICMTLLCRVLEARTAGSWISERATRLREQLKVACEEGDTAHEWILYHATHLKEQLKVTCEKEVIDDERCRVAFIYSHMLGAVLCAVPSAALCVSLGASYRVVLFVQIPFFEVMFISGTLLWLPRPWRVWLHEKIYDWPTWPGIASRRSKDETLTEADMGDRKEVENKDEVLSVADDMDDTDDTWSSNLDTPSETESSHSNDTSTSTNNIRTGRAAIQDTSLREATRAGFTPETAASYLDAFFPPPPFGMIILQVKKGTDFRENMVVLMYKTTPFVQLKDKLRKKDEDDSELVLKTPRGNFPVFDNETPSSVSPVHRVLICCS